MQTGPRARAAARGSQLWMCLIVASVACLTGCPGADVKEDKVLIDTGLFSHTQHLADDAEIRGQNGGKLLGCEDCHAVDRKNDFLVLRPGSQAHAPCDGCHVQKFYEEPGEFCAVCHESLDPLHAGKSPTFDYPRRQVAAQLVSSFNHRVHLAGERVKKDGGEKLECGDCHGVPNEASAYATFPKHKNCVQCHGGAVSPRLDDCNGCHAANGPGRARAFIKNDIRFTHGKHSKDKDGKAIACKTCHAAVEKSSSQDDLNLPQMADCAKCHQDSSKTPDRVRISNCGLCHTTDVKSRALPGSHTASVEPADDLDAILAALNELDPLVDGGVWVQRLPDNAVADISGIIPSARDIAGSQKPENHTAFFRLNHEQAASSKDAKCSYCHTGLSGSPRDSCKDCHSTWKPRNHSLRWKSSEHGRQAAANPQRCAACHEVDFCSSCHAVPPPNHSPLNTFRYRHGRVARFNVRACVTCHTFETTCIECHTQNIVPIRSLQ